MQTSSAAKHDAFAEDVQKGLSSTPKFLSSKYFYDDEGSRLFQKIMELPEYYLTRAEFEIFSICRREIFAAFGDRQSGFDLIELGAGDGTKTAVLIDYFLAQNADFTYLPIDISQEAVDILTAKFARQFPALKMNARTGDYFRILESLKSETERRKILMFLGSNIGNFSRDGAIEFFQSLNAVMNAGDLLLIGFDLQKAEEKILAAYDDSQGITAQFNLNLLTRINRELGANFDLNSFSHRAVYKSAEGAARSFLVSLAAQKVFVEAVGQTFEFKKNEQIYMEISQKFNLQMIENFAQIAGFQIKRNFFDTNGYFTDSLWEKTFQR